MAQNPGDLRAPVYNDPATTTTNTVIPTGVYGLGFLSNETRLAAMNSLVGVAVANESIFESTGYSLTGSSTQPMINLAGTWNTSGTPTAFKLNMTATAVGEGTNTRLADFQIGGLSRFRVYNTTFGSGGAFYVASALGGVEVTIGGGGYTTWTSSGFSCTGQLASGGILTITQTHANHGIIASTGYSLTGSNATNMVDLAGTWNTSGSPTGIKLNITNTASGAASKLMDLQIGSSSKLNVDLDGAIYLNGGTTPSISRRSDVDMLMLHQASGGAGLVGIGSGGFYPGVNISNAGQLAFMSDTPASSRDLIIRKKGVAILQLGNDAAGVTNQTITVPSRITSDGIGANLTLDAGNGLGGASGSLIFRTAPAAATGVAGTYATRLMIESNGGYYNWKRRNGRQ